MCFGGGKQTVTQKNETVLTPEQKELQKMAMGSIQGAVSPTGQTNIKIADTPGFDPAQTAAQDSVLAKTAAGGSVQNAADDMARVQHFLSGDVMDVNTNPYLKGAIDAAVRPLTENFQSTVIPGLRTEAISAGALGDPKNKQAGQQAANSYMRQVGDTSAGFANTAYGQGLDAMVKGQALAPATQQALLFPEAAAESVGAQRRGLIEQQNATKLSQDSLPITLGMQLLNASAGAPGGGSTSTVTPATPGGGWTQALGTGLSAISALAGFL